MKQSVLNPPGLELFAGFAASRRSDIEVALREYLPTSSVAGTDRFNQALEYVVFPGGKRLRMYLTLVASLLGGAPEETGLKLACAIEFIHTSSITLDDLPAMDDANLRRNRRVVHLEFGEGASILVAISLLNQAYVLFSEAVPVDAPANRRRVLINEAASCIGSGGMIAGQSAEMLFSGSNADDSVLTSRELKTTGLMRLMMTAGGIAAGALDSDIAALATFGERLGQAYQIYDDLADASGNRQMIGKDVGQDSRHLRPTMLVGLDGNQARRHAEKLVEMGKKELERFGNRREAEMLRSAADFIVSGFGGQKE